MSVRVLTIVLLAIGLARGLSLLCASPLVALANNYDMIRVQACVDVYPIRDESIPLWANSYQAPLDRYQFAHLDTPCYFTSEVIFAVAALPAMWLESRVSQDGGFSIRWVGALKYALLAAMGLFFTGAIHRRSRRAGLAHAVFFAVIVNDPGILVYLSTFNAEFAAAFFLYLMLSLIVVDALGWKPGSRVVNVGYSVLLVLAPTLLATSKVQHLVTPLCLLAIVWGLQYFRPVFSKRMLVLLSAGALLGLLAQLAHMGLGMADSMKKANISNTVFTAVLPSSDDPLALVTRLGLPAECAKYAGVLLVFAGRSRGQAVS